MSEIFDKNSKIYVILFALLTSVICSLLITGAAVGLKKRQEINKALDRKANLLRAVRLVGEHTPSKAEIDTLYDTHIKEVRVDNSGRIIDSTAMGALQLYLYIDGDAIKGYILPIDTRGLWGKIRGYLAFESDGETVYGFSVFSHSETPGLGGEIESSWFQKNFQGKKILNSQDKFVSVKIAKGKAENLPDNIEDNYVDGISGATLTGRYLTEGIENTLEKYNPVSIIFRQKNLKPSEIKQP